MMRELAYETAEALLKAIKDAAPDANQRGTDGLESLARAYAAVVGSAPESPERKGRGGATVL